MEEKKVRNIYFSEKEVTDFHKLCQVHGFKNKSVVKDHTKAPYQFQITLPSISGSVEKLLSNIARYTNSRRVSEPVKVGNNMKIRVLFNHK